MRDFRVYVVRPSGNDVLDSDVKVGWRARDDNGVQLANVISIPQEHYVEFVDKLNELK